jgi:hypothetical protein
MAFPFLFTIVIPNGFVLTAAAGFVIRRSLHDLHVALVLVLVGRSHAVVVYVANKAARDIMIL